MDMNGHPTTSGSGHLLGGVFLWGMLRPIPAIQLEEGYALYESRGDILMPAPFRLYIRYKIPLNWINRTLPYARSRAEY
jgi:hypothetical protein